MSQKSGQILLLGLLLVMMMVLSLAVVVFLNQMGTLHQTASAQRIKAESIAREGIAYATQQLSRDAATWQNALKGIFTGTDCNTGNVVLSPSGGRFKLSCSNDTTANPNLQPYQVAVTAVASMARANGTDMPLRAIRAYLSQRTLGTDFSTDLHAAAALQLVFQPNTAGTLDVHWGPIVCLDANTNGQAWTLPSPINTQRYPRKFSQGGLISTTWSSTLGSGLTSDQKEYWAYAPQSPPPVIDETYYISQATGVTTGITPPTVNGTALSPGNATHPCLNPNCGYFDNRVNNHPGGLPAVFTGNGSGYKLPPGQAGPVIYVDGPAEFDRIDIDGATFIITGDLTMTDAAGGHPRTLHVPFSAPSEYPYSPSIPTSWPCSNNVGGTCQSSQVFSGALVQFRGFLYVKGNLNVMVPGWNMVGSLLVGDPQATTFIGHQLIIPAGDGLSLAYDDLVNHGIHVNPVSGTSIKVEPDLLQDVPAF
jgi:hypothetical protein